VDLFAAMRSSRDRIRKAKAAWQRVTSQYPRLFAHWAWVPTLGGDQGPPDQRASGRRARQCDLTDAIVDLLPQLGVSRGMDAVSTVPTAVGGPPGSAAASLLYELARHPDWAAKVAEELCGLTAADFAAAPTRAAPLTHRFIKEVLRLWSPPLVLVRPARVTVDVGTTRLA
jgi:hypothetical protein